MSDRKRSPLDERTLERLGAYHDGELSGLSRWRIERKLRRSGALRAELAALRDVSATLRSAAPAAEDPDLWDSIALRLPAADARRAEGAAQASAGFGWLAWPGAGAAVASAGLALAFAFGWFDSVSPVPGSVVRWIDGGGRDVMVLEGEPDTTIIWVIDGPTEAAGGGVRVHEHVHV